MEELKNGLYEGETLLREEVGALEELGEAFTYISFRSKDRRVTEINLTQSELKTERGLLKEELHSLSNITTPEVRRHLKSRLEELKGVNDLRIRSYSFLVKIPYL